MKGPKIILLLSVLFLLAAGFNAYSQEDTPKPMPAIEARGSRIGNSAASTPVVLPKEGVITYVDTGIGHSFTIVRVYKDGTEEQVLGVDSPELAIGKILSAGTYKVYPDKVEDGLKLGEITVVVHIGFVEEQ